MGKVSLKEINDERNLRLKQNEQAKLLVEMTRAASNTVIVSTVADRFFANWLIRWAEIEITGRDPTTPPFSTHHE